MYSLIFAPLSYGVGFMLISLVVLKISTEREKHILGLRDLKNPFLAEVYITIEITSPNFKSIGQPV